MKKKNDEKSLKAIKMYENGVLVNKICYALGISMSQLYHVLKKHNVPLRQAKKSLKEIHKNAKTNMLGGKATHEKSWFF